MTEKEQFKLMHVKIDLAQNNGVELIKIMTKFRLAKACQNKES